MVVAIRTNLECISKGKGDRLWLFNYRGGWKCKI